MPSTTIKYFRWSHLPPDLQEIARPLAEMADWLEANLDDGSEKSAGMRHLLEAKDCFVRVKLDMREAK